MSTATIEQATTTRLHLSLNVKNLDQAVGFYRILFGVEPAKHYSDYAKFELQEPALVLSLEPSQHGGGGTLNHLGFRMPDSATLVAMQERLEAAGISSQREEGVECCYARQTKFWVTDPDKTLWEIYTLEEDIEHRGPGQKMENMLPQQESAVAPATREIWEHRMGTDISLPIDEATDSKDEVLLRGTFNAPITEDRKRTILQEAFRILKPGGKLFVHVLTAESPLQDMPSLPGPAAAVKEAPVESLIPQLLAATGFVRVEMVKFKAKPCFVIDGKSFRELQLNGYKPANGNEMVSVLYKGPHAEVKDDLGNTYPRGQRVSVDPQVVQSLENGPDANGFVIFR